MAQLIHTLAETRMEFEMVYLRWAEATFSWCFSRVSEVGTYFVNCSQGHHQAGYHQVGDGQGCHQVVGDVLQVPLEDDGCYYENVSCVLKKSVGC